MSWKTETGYPSSQIVSNACFCQDSVESPIEIDEDPFAQMENKTVNEVKAKSKNPNKHSGSKAKSSISQKVRQIEVKGSNVEVMVCLFSCGKMFSCTFF